MPLAALSFLFLISLLPNSQGRWSNSWQHLAHYNIACAVLSATTPPWLQLAEQLPGPPNNSSFPLGRCFWLSVLCEWGKRALLWSHIALPGARAGGKERDAADQGSSVSSLTSPLGWVMGTHPVSLSSAQSMPDRERTDIIPHNKAREEKNYN